MEVSQRKLTRAVHASGDAVSHPENSLNQSTIPDQKFHFTRNISTELS